MLGLKICWIWNTTTSTKGEIFKSWDNISALWDFVRIIHQKQNRLKFIIMICFRLDKIFSKATLQISRRAVFCSLDTSCLYRWQNVSIAYKGVALKWDISWATVDVYLMPENRKLPLFASEAKEVENYSVDHPIWKSILLVQDDPDQDIFMHISCQEPCLQ